MIKNFLKKKVNKLSLNKISGYLFWLFFLVLFVFRYQETRPVYKEGDRVRISAKVSSEPIRYDKSQYLKIQGLSMYLGRDPEILYGDGVVVEGSVSGGKLTSAKLIGKKKNGGYLYKIRSQIISFYRKSLPEPHASLLAGVTLGSKSSIPEDFWGKLKKTGTAHVVVASGMNVTLVAGFLLNFLILFIPRPKAGVFAIAGIWLYVFLSGFEAPIIRAGVMGTVSFFALAMGRISEAKRALLISAALMLLVSPRWLFDLGFILSFVATGSLLLFGRAFKEFFSFFPLPRFIKEGLYTSLAAQVGVAPILYYTFGYVSILSPLVNALVLWTIPAITIIGMVSGLLCLISQPLAGIVLALTYPLSLWFTTIVSLFS